MKANTRKWIYGLLSSVISSAAGVTAVIAIDPVDFNLGTGLTNVFKVAFVMGVIALFNYLQKHPIPEWQESVEGENDLW